MGTLANIPIGAGKITLLGVDLGWTAGGITLTVEEKATPLSVDQYGGAATVLDERITGTSVKFKVPLAEGALITLMESIFAGAAMETGDILYYLRSGVGIDRYLYSGVLTLELLTDETTVESGDTPNKWTFYKAAPKGAVTITYAGWEKQIVYEFEIECYPLTRENGAGVGTLNTWTKTTPSINWTADMWNGFILVDAAAAEFVIQDSAATTLTVIGTPSTGTYSIKPLSKRDWGAGVGTLNTWTDTDKAWTTNAWVGYTLTDDASVEFTITANNATTLTVSGTPTTGDYTIGGKAGTGLPTLGYRGKV